MPYTNVVTYQHRSDGEGTYPFTDFSTFTSNEGNFIAPDAFIDATIYTIGGGVRQHISRLERNSTYLIVDISDITGVLCSGKLSLNSNDNKIVLYDSRERIVGLLVGNTDTGKFLGSIPEGVNTFNDDGLEFVGTCVAPQPQRVVEGLTTEDGDMLAGDVWLVGKDGVILDWDAAQSAIVMHLVGDPLFRKRNCDTGNGTFTNPVPLQALTFVTDLNTSVKIKPDEYGNIRFVTGTNQNEANVLRIEKLDHGLRLKAIGNIT